jgi:cell shape-determining protein MreC
MFLISSLSAWSQVEELVYKDSTYLAPIDGVFIDLGTYVGISYELEKLEELKKETPGLKSSLDSLKTLQDSLTAAQMSENKEISKMLDLEKQSKTALKQRVFNLQHNYNIVDNKWRRARKQRNALSGGILALIAGILLF